MDPAPLQPDRLRRRARVENAILLVAGIGAVIVTFIFDPAGPAGRFFPKCYLHEWTGLYCPGCGATRALHHVVHGQVALAIRYNAFFVLVGLPVLIGMLVHDFARRDRAAAAAAEGIRSHRTVWIAHLIGAGLLLFTVLRNIPLPPFSYLAPP